MKENQNEMRDVNINNIPGPKEKIVHTLAPEKNDNLLPTAYGTGI